MYCCWLYYWLCCCITKCDMLNNKELPWCSCYHSADNWVWICKYSQFIEIFDMPMKDHTNLKIMWNEYDPYTRNKKKSYQWCEIQGFNTKFIDYINHVMRSTNDE